MLIKELKLAYLSLIEKNILSVDEEFTGRIQRHDGIMNHYESGFPVLETWKYMITKMYPPKFGDRKEITVDLFPNANKKK